MFLKAYTIRDAKTEAFSNPFYAPNRPAGVRLFDGIVNDPSSTIYANPEDFALFEIGVFDDGVGLVTSELQPVHVINALDVKRDAEAYHSDDMTKLSKDIVALRNAVSNAMLQMSRPPVQEAPVKKSWWRF